MTEEAIREDFVNDGSAAFGQIPAVWWRTAELETARVVEIAATRCNSLVIRGT